MLVCNIHKFFLLLGIENRVEFLVSKGITRPSATKYVYSHRKHPSWAMIEKFCKIFDCLPNDIIEWHPQKPEDTKYKLMELAPQDNYNIKKLLSGIPPEKALEFAKRVEEVKKELLSNN